jgi:hypothetical protein
MSQLVTLIWLKWRLFRNTISTRKAAVNQIFSLLGTLVSLAFALLIALGLGIAAYVITSKFGMAHLAQARAASRNAAEIPPADFIFFLIFSFLFMIWATLPLSIGGGSQFDPGRLLMYPVSLRKLFAIDLVSELTSLSSLFAVPAILAMAIGAGLATGSMLRALVAAVPAIIFGIALAKWLATSIGSLVRRRRTRGETILALIGALAGLSGAFMGQLAPIVMRHAGSFRGLRWTPPGAAALAFSGGLGDKGGPTYILALLILSAYASALIVATYWMAQRSVLGKGERKRRKPAITKTVAREIYTGWGIPFLPADLSAVIEKELRYALRNAQLRMMALMPMILLAVRYMNTRRIGRSRGLSPDAALQVSGFLRYGEALMVTGGVLYVFLILAGVACNEFAFEEGGMRTLILSPIDRRKILIGKNIVVTLIALFFSTVLLILNEILFRDLNLRTILFVALSFVVFAAMMTLTGNWFSIRFPKRMKFGKRMNVSGVAGFLLIPIMLVMALPPLAAVGIGYFNRSLPVEYVTLALFAGLSLALYFPLIKVQGRSLERHEREVLEAVSKEAES